ncbi:MAG: sialidase [Verrucomicrobiales bacterium]|nr:sialidase [Verrucomicrobiales bacterium]
MNASAPIRRLMAAFLAMLVLAAPLAASDAGWESLKSFVVPPAEYVNDFGRYRSPLQFSDGRPVKNADDWAARRREILEYWHKVMGPWPALLERPGLNILRTESRENFTQHRVRLDIAPGQTGEGWLLVPEGRGPFPAVLVPFYEPETSIGLKGLKGKNCDFAYQLARRGFVTLSIGSPGGDARRPEIGGASCQPLSFLAYVAANAHTALAQRPEVDPQRIGIVGHSYGGKWAMFASCLYDKFACAAWSDPGIVFDERDRRQQNPNGSVNYWDVWYLGGPVTDPKNPGGWRKLPSEGEPRTGAYKVLIEAGHDLVELHALMSPRPFLVSGGTADLPERWPALNHAIAVNKLLGFTNRVAMTNRATHEPTPDSNEVIYRFFEHFLGKATPSAPGAKTLRPSQPITK